MFLAETIKYDGHILHQRFAYRYFNKDCNPLGNILVFRGAMEVLADAMLDQEDLLNEAFIYSDDALNFLWEIPLLNHPFGAVAYQRLFNSELAAILAQDFLAQPVQMRGDDIMVAVGEQWYKASVSITHVKDNVTLGHTGINIEAGSRAPSFAYSTHLTQRQVIDLAHQVIARFYALNQDIFIASAKV